MLSFCNHIYSSLSISYVTMDVFTEFCTTKISMKYQRRDEEVWRNFTIDTHKICSILHAWRRKGEIDAFMDEHGSTDGYLSNVLEELG